MTVDRWLMIALVLGTWFASPLTVFLQFRIAQPRPANHKDIAVSSAQGKRGFFYHYGVKVLSGMCVLISICGVIHEARLPGPLTRSSVVETSALVASVVLNIMAFSFVCLIAPMADRILKLVGRSIEMATTQEERILELESEKYDPARTSPSRLEGP